MDDDLFRFAHSSGHTELCASNDGTILVTCGSDGDIRTWHGIEDDNPTSLSIGDAATALALSKTHVFAAADDWHVRSYIFPDCTVEATLVRCTGTVTHLSLNKDETLLAVASSDMEIRIVNVKNLYVERIIGHEGPVLSVALHPTKEILASSSCDGTVRLWSLVPGEPTELHRITCLDKYNSEDATQSRCRMDWQATGMLLAIPCKNEVKMLCPQDSRWKEVDSFVASNGTSKHFCAATFSPCNKYLAAGSTTGVIVVWNVENKGVIRTVKSRKQHPVCSLHWLDEPIRIVYCDTSGEMRQLKVQFNVPIEAVPPNEDTSDDIISISRIKASLGFNEDNEWNELSIKQEKRPESRATTATNADLSDSEYDVPETSKERVTIAPVLQFQKSFQPGSTSEHLEHRFLVWNGVGIVCGLDTDDENVLEVEFHDAGIHHSLRLSNTHRHTMAALSTEALVLANRGDKGSGDLTGGHLQCLPLNTHPTAEWDLTLPTSERIIGIAVGSGWLAVATTANHIRFYGLHGTQRCIVGLAGPLLSLAGHKNSLMVVYHITTGLLGFQLLAFKSTSHMFPVATAVPTLPLPPNTSVTWVGFSEGISMPCIADSMQTMWFCRLGVWVPLITESKQKLFPVHVVQNSDQVWLHCLPCKGDPFPVPIPKPVPFMVQLKMPVTEFETEKAQWEQTAILSQIQPMQENWNDAALRESLMKLFALACRSQQDGRALEIAAKMASSHAIRLAAKYAAKLRRGNLAEELASMAVGVDEMKELEEQDNETDQGNISSYADHPADRYDTVCNKLDNPLLSTTRAADDGESQPLFRSSPAVFRNPFKKREDNSNQNKRKMTDEAASTSENISRPAKRTSVQSKLDAFRSREKK